MDKRMFEDTTPQKPNNEITPSGGATGPSVTSQAPDSNTALNGSPIEYNTPAALELENFIDSIQNNNLRGYVSSIVNSSIAKIGTRATAEKYEAAVYNGVVTEEFINYPDKDGKISSTTTTKQGVEFAEAMGENPNNHDTSWIMGGD